MRQRRNEQPLRFLRDPPEAVGDDDAPHPPRVVIHGIHAHVARRNRAQKHVHIALFNQNPFELFVEHAHLAEVARLPIIGLLVAAHGVFRPIHAVLKVLVRLDLVHADGNFVIGFAQQRLDPRRRLRALLARVVRPEHNEFVAADSVGIRQREHTLHRAGHRAEHAVPGLMPQMVVDFVQADHVDIHARQRFGAVSPPTIPNRARTFCD